MIRPWYALGWSSLSGSNQVNVMTKKHMTKDESKQKRKVARASRKHNRR